MCGTDAEQTLHSRCVDVEASGRRYTVIKNSVIACGLFPLRSLFLLFLFSPRAQSVTPLLPSFRHKNYGTPFYFTVFIVIAGQTCRLYFTGAVSQAPATIYFPCCLSYIPLISSFSHHYRPVCIPECSTGLNKKVQIYIYIMHSLAVSLLQANLSTYHPKVFFKDALLEVVLKDGGSSQGFF